ncbi:hypothetical protein GOBAR_AA01318 [Gossypium barbadense]|uniref:Uncharacterized protein n=1 Tax=Gossypium barbadense TaxID=3634 RepID=A0A2P5YUJ2_GOSBA|nr:hypothetical protein GOBAR_AA01318 [Gossypium barbadense]
MENSLKVFEGDEGSQLFEDRNTKNVRFKEVSNGTFVDMAVDADPPSNAAMSWKDKLFGTGSSGTSQDVAEFEGDMDEDFILLDDDIIRTNVNRIPTIEFSDRVKEILYKEMEMTVVLKLLGRNISYWTTGVYVQKEDSLSNWKYDRHVKDLCSLPKETLDKVNDKVVADSGSISGNGDPEKISEPAFDARKRKSGSRFNALTVEGEKTGGEKGMLADLKEINIQAVESDVANLGSEEEDFIKSLPSPVINKATNLDIGSSGQKRTYDLGLDSDAQTSIINSKGQLIRGESSFGP